VIEAAVAALDRGAAPLASVEGFVRQILGWRELVRGLYWRHMPGWLDQNALGADRPLPAFYWTGETEMACLRAVLQQTLEHGYAHHIQRLMVTGNFALLAGIDPKAVCEWYLCVYADAYEWVELPNTHGMALFADGGILSSKPYAASGKYIERMSDYCRHCRYNVKELSGADSCPFNALYWNFVAENYDTLARNPRMAMICRTLARMSPARIEEIRKHAQALLDA
jgi:deoxyribodipyrimidine photolyase-related protein